MPAIERTTQDAIVAAARALVDAAGVDAVTMSAVATAVGVKAPSLYKRVRDRDALVALVAGGVVAELGSALRRAADAEPDPSAALRATADALRAYAHAHPRAYLLVFGGMRDESAPPVSDLARAAEPALEPLRRLVGEDDAMDAARTFTSWANGFVTMEISGAFRLGGDVDAAFAWGRDLLLDAFAARR